MVAVTTDPIHWSDTPPRSVRSGGSGPRGVAAPAGPAVPVGAAQRLVLVALAVVLVVVVAVGSAALGRVLDSQRGIPAGPAAASTTHP